MNPIPLPGTGYGDTHPVISKADVLAVLPAFWKRDDTAPVRDGLVAALTAIMLAYQTDASYAAAMVDILRAQGTYLDGLGNDRGVPRALGELDPSYRVRLLALPSLVTPTAILAGVNAILAPYTAIKAQYSESVQDRWYVRSAQNIAQGFHSFVWKAASTTGQRSPYYLDRLYEDDSAQNGGYVRPQSSPGGARVFKDTIGRFLVLRVPDLSALDAIPVCAFRTTNDPVATATPVYWNPSTPYSTLSIGGPKYYLPTQANQTGYWYTPSSSTAKLSGLVEPTWPRVPGQVVLDNQVTWICRGVLHPVGLGMFAYKTVSQGSPSGAYIRSFSATAPSVYAAISNLVDRIRGASIRFAMFVDPKLTATT